MKKKDIILDIVLIVLYVSTIAMLTRVAKSQDVMMILGRPAPLSALAGVFSSIANLCIILMVIMLGNLGFVTAITLMTIQFPFMAAGFLVQQRATSISGIFSNLLTLTAIIVIYRRNRKIELYQKNEMEDLRGQRRISQRLFEQTATALVNAIDAKDTYSHGHSIRVAEYSEKIARTVGKSEEESRMIYYAALLHDVGKIGIPISIINKNGKLTKEEYETVKQHPVLGNQILSSIKDYPYLSLGAHYHHERYDGKGYPEGLKGEDIPEIARIISVADAYDAMSSNRSYRRAIPQQLVREEIIKGSGTQFDPEFAKAMQHLIDCDTEYRMREKNTVSELAGKNCLECLEYRSEISEGIVVTDCITTMRVKSTPYGGRGQRGRGSAMILFDSLDEHVHEDEQVAKDLNYFEYCEIWFDGKTTIKGARKASTEIRENLPREKDASRTETSCYVIKAVKVKDHVKISIDDGSRTAEVTIALPYSSRFAYIGLTGEYCRIEDVSIIKETKPVGEDHIQRIAEEISFIRTKEGDIPNVQMDGYRADSSVGIPLNESLDLSFHSMSLPTARLIWHCACVVFFTSSNGRVNDEDYREYSFFRLDGESWESEGAEAVSTVVERRDEFEGWEYWKEENKKGIDCKVHISRENDVITATTQNLGIYIKHTIRILDDPGQVYVSLSGDQCAITDIHIR